MKNSESTKEQIKLYFRNQTPGKRRGKRNSNQIHKILWIFALLIILTGFTMDLLPFNFPSLKSYQPPQTPCIWDICAIDTMKTSRDKAKAELNNPGYDEDIKSQLKLIKQTGATYVTIGTPYDDQFLPYLKRWVTLARAEDLKVWFRGNWSNWEGWFDYPKNMTPKQHTDKTKKFITSHPELFEDGDIFDPCPECENSGLWPQNAKNADYNKFVINQQKETTDAFKSTGKNVRVFQSIIGGRAKDVLVKDSFNSLGNIIAIDHYVKSPEVMEEFINYFWQNSGTRSLVSEYGNPIPDLNGPQNDKDQAEFLKKILEVLYRNRSKVAGLNYWVLSEGTTSLINEDGSPRPAFFVLQEYFSPGEIYGNIKNPLNENLKGIPIKSTDGASVVFTDENGNFKLSIPPRSIEIEVGGEDYIKQKFSVIIDKSGRQVKKDFMIEPLNPGILYRLRLWWKNYS